MMWSELSNAYDVKSLIMNLKMLYCICTYYLYNYLLFNININL